MSFFGPVSIFAVSILQVPTYLGVRGEFFFCLRGFIHVTLHTNSYEFVFSVCVPIIAKNSILGHF